MAIVTIAGKCSDLCFTSFLGIHHHGYVPNIPGIGGGDYIEIEIENETGKIVGWKPLTIETYKEAIE